MIDALDASVVDMQAGGITVPLTSDKNHTAGVLTDWRSEAGSASTSGDRTFSRLTFTLRSLVVLVIVSRGSSMTA